MNSKTPSKKSLSARKSETVAPDTTASEKDNLLAIEFPRDGFGIMALDNLQRIIASKETLIKKALKADNLPIAMKEETLSFPWFTLSGDDGETDAYTRFISAICEMAKRQKRVVAKKRDTENDKFTMRLFLVRLGFIGEEYRTARRILLKNLTGNGSFKNGQRPKKAIAAKDDGETALTGGAKTDGETALTGGAKAALNDDAKTALTGDKVAPAMENTSPKPKAK